MKAINLPAKPYVQIVCSGYSGCRYYRSSKPAFVLNWMEPGPGFHCIETPQPIMEPGMLQATRSIVLKSPAGWQALELVKQLKAAQQKFGFRIVADYDDTNMRTPDCIHEGDVDFDAISTKSFDDKHNEATAELMKLCDLVTCTKEYLRQKFIRAGVSPDNVVVIPNAVSRGEWSLPRREPLKEDLKQLHIVLTQCPQHYHPAHRNEQGEDVAEELGDYASAEWKDWVIKHVQDGDVRLTQLGNASAIWNPIQDKVQSLPWVQPHRYAALVCRLKPDLILAPLVPNEVNRCRSDLRYVEAAVSSSAFLGSVFADSPYERVPELSRVPQGATIEQLDEKLRQLKDRDTYNKLIADGWDFLLKDGRILESDKCLNRYVDAWGSDMNNIAFDLL